MKDFYTEPIGPWPYHTPIDYVKYENNTPGGKFIDGYVELFIPPFEIGLLKYSIVSKANIIGKLTMIGTTNLKFRINNYWTEPIPKVNYGLAQVMMMEVFENVTVTPKYLASIEEFLVPPDHALLVSDELCLEEGINVKSYSLTTGFNRKLGGQIGTTGLANNSIADSSTWKKEGRCPQCGELGPYINGAPVCKTHGVY